MKVFEDDDLPGSNELLFLPLGGTGEIGMNLNLYGHSGKWLMVDLGVMFRDNSSYQLDVIMANPRFIAQRRGNLSGLILTHGHEDHIGAVPYLWPQLRCPIYATPFTANLVRRKLKEAGLAKQAPVTEVQMSGKFDVGPFKIELVTLTHSIPEPNAVVIRTSLGTIVHTGDWKLDQGPLVGPVVDEESLIGIGQSGVLAMVCDSTNALIDGRSGSEAELRCSLENIVRGLKHRVAVGCFASNVARLETLAHVAEANGRHPVLIGRSMWRIYDAAREVNYLSDVPRFLTADEARGLPRDQVLFICTGSQGEARAALTRIARRQIAGAELDRGDTAIFSSRIIPGNEKSIERLQTRLKDMGVEVITKKDAFVHVSGHPARDELKQMYQWLRPQIAIPVHGEPEHLDAHVTLAGECQVPDVFRINNGDVVRFAPGVPQIVAGVSVGRLGVEKSKLVPLEPNFIAAHNSLSLDDFKVDAE